MWMIALFLSLTFYAALECSGENLRNSDTSKSLRKESNHLHVFRHSSKQLSSRSDLVKTVRVEQDYIHEVMFAIKQKNMDKLTDILHDVSDPQSPNYGQHWTREEVANLTSNPEAHDALISYLHSNGASVLSESLAGEYIKVKAPVRVWEKMFNTKFFLFDKTHLGKIIGSVVRSEELWIPKELDIHIACVLNTIDLPFRSTQRPSVKKLSPPSIKEYESKGSLATKDYSWAVSYDGYITPYKIRKFYNMSLSTTGSSKSTQAIYSTYDEYFSPKNLFSFQQEYMSLSITSMNKSYGDSSNDAYCSQYELCVEGSLDSQYLMGTSPLSPTIFWWTNNFFDDFLYEVSSSTNVPLIISISWGISEQYLYSDVFDTFNTQAIKLGTMGTTIFVSSGDSGSNSYYCGYDVSFPASSPYVTSIGGTSGPENDNFVEEVASSANATGAFTTGGGFSSYYPTPTFQKKAVADYFLWANTTGNIPYSGFGVNGEGGGRGFPDLSLIANNFIIYTGKQEINVVGGTSASCPTVAGFFSNINAARMKIGKSSVGWVNPVLYSYYQSFTNDIVSGNTLCTDYRRCCQQGFYAAPGWDPASGLGSINYGKLESLMLILGNDVNGVTLIPSHSPTVKPTQKPTTARTGTLSPSPSFKHSDVPSIKPSGGPRSKPSGMPSVKPSGKPSVKPTGKPSRMPSIAPSSMPRSKPSAKPNGMPNVKPNGMPSVKPSGNPSGMPNAKSTGMPSIAPSGMPSIAPSSMPSIAPSDMPSIAPSGMPSIAPSGMPSIAPSGMPSIAPSGMPSVSPTSMPSIATTGMPSIAPSGMPSIAPSSMPSVSPTGMPSIATTGMPSIAPSGMPSIAPTGMPSIAPTGMPSIAPSSKPSDMPSIKPSGIPSIKPTGMSSITPTGKPSDMSTLAPSGMPSIAPSGKLSGMPSIKPSDMPSIAPTGKPSGMPSIKPSGMPSVVPTGMLSIAPTGKPSFMPSIATTGMPSIASSSMPSIKPTGMPSIKPTGMPSVSPTGMPSIATTGMPNIKPTGMPSIAPTGMPSIATTGMPSIAPTGMPSIKSNIESNIAKPV